MDYITTIGIEIHAQLKTKSKMFSPALVNFDALANTCVSSEDMAFPGTLPSLNKRAVEYGLKVCYGLNMEIDSLLRFDRKNYFYSDLPKGFQITQQFHPLGRNGTLILDDGTQIGVTRLHLEEDTAKQTHEGNFTYIDFNRAGVPLIEIVSEPQLHTGKQAAEYVANLRQLLLYLDVSDGKMEEGSLRCDVNISISNDPNRFGTKVEIKNLNSTNNIQKAIEFEEKRQRELLEKGEAIIQETRRFDEASQKTVSMRKKEGAIDYRYFPEPNIVPIQLSDTFLENVKQSMGELPNQRLARYRKDLTDVDAKILVANKAMGDFYDAVMSETKFAQPAANMVISQVASFGLAGFKATEIGVLVNKLQDKTLSSKQGKQVLELLNGSDKSVEELIKEYNLVQVSNDSVIIGYIEQVLSENPQVLIDYRAGKDKPIKFVMGQVMKLSKGQVNPALAQQLVVKTLLEKV